jgi:predicted metalloprotease with PDZ domain
MYKIKHQLFPVLKYNVIILLAGLNLFSTSFAQTPVKLSLVVSADDPSSHLFHVQINYETSDKATLHFRMCAWTPGFYEIKNFGENVSNFRAADISGKAIVWNRSADSTWNVRPDKKNGVIIDYDVKADNTFIANAYLDNNYGYFVPGAVCMYLNEQLRLPLTVKINNYKNWPKIIATGLDPIPGKKNTYLVKDFDELYDSPFLLGKLQQFPAATVKGKKIQFIGYNMGSFYQTQFMADLSKITASGSEIIGDIPYNHYTFLGIGMPIHGFAGIEHLNSSSLMMGNDSAYLAHPEVRESMYSLLAHEYFHLYNVKRIRPIALGPFDYTKENYTNMLWVSEGFTDYYEYIILRRAGLMSRERVLANYQEHISNYENTPGHLYQSLTQSSRGIWAQRGVPQQRTPEEIAKTISVYDKGCVLGMLLDLKIRHETHNKRSLDDVMRGLYRKYYQVKKRGFTDLEFQKECETIAAVPLKELFSYSTTVKAVNYPKYLAYAGLQIDTATKALPGLTFGAELRFSKKDTSMIVTGITWPSPADDAGIKAGDKIMMIDGKRVDKQIYDSLMMAKHPGDKIQVQIKRDKQVKIETVVLSVHYEKSFSITPIEYPDELQAKIYKDWLR